MGPGRQAASSKRPTSPSCQGTLSLLGAADKGMLNSPCVPKESQRKEREHSSGAIDCLTKNIWLGRVAPSWKLP